jgi:hypothetical protein
MSPPLVSVTMAELQAPAMAHAMALSWQARILAAVLTIALMLTDLRLSSRLGRRSQRQSPSWFLAGLGVLAGAAFPGSVEAIVETIGLRDSNVVLLSVTLVLSLSLVLELSAVASGQAVQIARQARERRELQKIAARLLAGEPVGPLIAARLLDGGSLRSGEDAGVPR